MTRKNSILFVGAFPDACALWRMQMPHMNLPGSSHFIWYGEPNFTEVASHDILVVQRCYAQSQFNFMRICREIGLKIVYDLDDEVWSLPKFNPAHDVFEQVKAGFGTCMQLTDVVSVSTRNLAKAVKSHVKKQLFNPFTRKEIPVIVAENRLDLKMFSKPIKKDRFIVGWAGSNSHKEDLAQALPALVQCAKEHPEITFEFRGGHYPDEMKVLPNTVFYHWTPVQEFTCRMPTWGWSIGLAPLTSDEFNSSKSSIKGLESAYCGIPCLMSWVQPYEELCRHDPDLMWLLCAGKSNWYPKLKQLIEDDKLRETLGSKLKKVMEEHYSFNRIHEGWEEVFRIAKS